MAQIEGAAGSPNARARIKGFKEQLATYPDLQLVASQPGNWDRLTASMRRATFCVKTRISSGSTPITTAWRWAFRGGEKRECCWQTLVVGTDGIREAKSPSKLAR